MRLSRSIPILYDYNEKLALKHYDSNQLKYLKIKFQCIEGENIYSVNNGIYEKMKCKITLSNYRIQIFPVDDHNYTTAKLEVKKF